MNSFITKQRKINTIKKIKKIDVLIHRITLSGPYKYSDIENKGFNIAYKNNYNDETITKYCKRAWFWIGNRRIDLLLNPCNSFYRNCLMSLNLKDVNCKNILTQLYEKFSELSLSTVEYTVDIYPANNSSKRNVRNLFLFIARYLYLQKQKELKMYPTQGRNYTYKIGNKKLKAYERGDDDRKNAGGWDYEDINRVRIEYTARRAELVNYGFSTLEYFLADCKFSQIIEKKLNFKKFKNGSKKLPTEFNQYETLPGNIESFQETYNYHKKIKTVLNLTQSTIYDNSFDKLKKQIDNKVLRFQNKWARLTG